jgi:DNA-binding NarL/FixJ family response regulator
VQLLLGVHSREIRTALFLALKGVGSVSIVGTATTTAELVSLARALRPEVVVIEGQLPGEPLVDAIAHVTTSAPGCRIMLIETMSDDIAERSDGTVEVFSDIDELVTAVPGHGTRS